MSDQHTIERDNQQKEKDKIEQLLETYDQISRPEDVDRITKELARSAIFDYDNEFVALSILNVAFSDLLYKAKASGNKLRIDPTRQKKGAALLVALDDSIKEAGFLFKRSIPVELIDSPDEDIKHWMEATKIMYENTAVMAIASFDKVYSHQQMYKKLCFNRIKKSLFESTGLEQTDALITNYLRKVAAGLSGGYRFAMLQQAYPGVVELLRNVKVAVDTNTTTKAFVSHVRPLVYNRYSLCEEEKGVTERELFKLHRKIYSSLNYGSNNRDQVRKKSKLLLWQADRQKDTPAKQLPSILERTYGPDHISISSLFEKNIDIEAAGSRFLSILEGIPKGDIFMQQFMKEVFMFESDSDVSLNGITYFNDGGRTERIMEIQMWLADKLISPSYDVAHTDSTFDQRFSTALAQLNLFGVNAFGRMIHRAYIKSAETRGMFRKDQPISGLLNEISMPQEVRDQITEVTSPEQIRLMLITYLNTHSDAIQQNWRVRFFADYDKKMKPFEQAFMIFVTPPLQPRPEQVDIVEESGTETNPVTEFLQSRLTPQLIEQLKADEPEFREIQSEVWRLAKEGRKINYWMHPEGMYRLEFAPKTAMKLAGLREIQVTADPMKSDEYKVNIILDADMPPIEGVISGDGKFTLNAAQIPHELMTLIEHISVLSIHSLICRTKGDVRHITSDEVTKPAVEPSTLQESEERTEQVLRRLHDASTDSSSSGESRTQLPAHMSSGSGSSRQSRRVQTEGVRESHFVAGSIHGTPYSIKFVSLLASYNRLEAAHPGSAYTFRNAIAFNYRRMHKINDERWRNLPEHLRDQIQTVAYPFDDPLNNIRRGQPVPVQNWYSAHYNPGLENDKVVKPKKMYRLYSENYYGPLAYFHDWYMRAMLAGTIEESNQSETV